MKTRQFQIAFVLLGTLLPTFAAAQCLQDKTTSAQTFVGNFYQWYKSQKGSSYDAIFKGKGACFAPALLKLMQRERQGNALCPGEAFLDWDPFVSSNAFIPAEVTAKVGTESAANGIVQVPVTLTYEGGHESKKLILELLKVPYWQIKDLVDPSANIQVNQRFSTVLEELSKSIAACQKERGPKATK
ncbi:MAG: hypothetical protein K8R69_04070 [Deltaproteobacteria bacterium]|nr:hypothetical protein [Deltaproteobacteria bacterium]